MSEAPESPPSRPRLLLVDDEQYFRRFVGEIVRRHFDFELFEAKDGEEALQRFAEHNPDIVLLDINMPRLNGLETLVKLRELRDDTTIVMLTSISEEMIVEECAKLGASYFVRKDLPAHEIVSELRDVLGSLEPGAEG